MRVCPDHRCPSKGAPQPDSAFYALPPRSLVELKRCEACRSRARTTMARSRHRAERVKLLAGEMKKSPLEATVAELRRQLATEQRARRGLAAEVEALTARLHLRAPRSIDLTGFRP